MISFVRCQTIVALTVTFFGSKMYSFEMKAINKIKFFLLSLLIFSLPAGVQAKDFGIDPDVAEENAAAPSHEIWNKLLQKHVTPEGKVNYKGFEEDKSQLQAYLDILQKQGPQSSWSANEKMAYWINAYNAFTVKLILDSYPLTSITNLGKPWDKKFISIDGSTYSLNDIEHKILRPTFKDARIHFAVNCASISCPKLLNQAYTPTKIQGQLDRQTRSYLSSRHNEVNSSSLKLSKIFDWYKGDFNAEGGVIAFVDKYTSTDIQADASISYLNYNWNLNE